MNNLCKVIYNNIKPGMIFQNPGGGTSEVIKVSDKKIVYKRGKSNISLSYKDIEDAYGFIKMKGVCTSSELKMYRKSVFSSKDNGHSCNCTFLFSLLNFLDICTPIQGKGVRGNPFYIEVL